MSRKTSLGEIGKLLGAEGFTDFTATQVKNYWMRRTITPHSQARVAKLRKAFGAIVAEKLDTGDQFVLGKYIGMLCKASFDAGLRLGLLTLVADLDGGKQEES